MPSSCRPVCLSIRTAQLNYSQGHLPDERVHLSRLNIIQLLHRILDLPLVRLDVNNEHQRVVLLNLLHRRFRVQRSGRK